jgi:Glycosyltransferase family 87
MNSVDRIPLEKRIPTILAMVDWAGRHRFATAYLLIVVSWWPLFGSLGGYFKQGDVDLYEKDADALLRGEMPYRDTVVEYPPYAVPIFLLPRAFGTDNYLDGFRLLAALCDMLIRGGLFWVGIKHAKSLRALLPLICYCAGAPFLRFFFFQRFDLWPALICLVAVLLFSAGKAGWSGLAIAIGIGVKVYPAVFVPPLFILALRQGKARQFSIGLIAGLAPILLLSFVLPWWRFAQFQGDRGLQCESLFASLIWAAGHLGLTNATWVSVKRWTEVHGPMASALLPWARALFAVTVLSSVTIASLAATRYRQQLSLGGLARLLLVPLLAFVAFNTILSPQFMIWLLPLAAVGTLDGNPWPLLAISLATVLTPVIFPSFGWDYGQGLNLFETAILVTRNLILASVWWVLIKKQWQIWRHGQPAEPQPLESIS